MENKLSCFVGGINSTESKTNLMFAISSRIFFRKCCYFLWEVNEKKYLLLVRLEIRRESDKSIGSDSNLFFFFFVGQSHLSEERIRSKRIFLFSFFSPSSRLIIEMVAIRKLIAS